MKKLEIHNFLFFGLIILEFILLLKVNFSNSMTFDEIVYSPAGLSYFEKKDFRINVEHPPVFKYIISFPIYVLGYKNDYNIRSWAGQNQIGLGRNFYFERENLKSLNISRFSTNIATIFLSILLYIFVLKNFGKTEAFFSLIFFIFYPDTVAQGSLTTNDMYFSLFFFLSFISFYNYLKYKEKKFIYFTAISTSLSLLTKHTGLLIFPLYFITLIYFLFKKKIKILDIIKFFSILFLTAYFFIWVSYLFQNKVLIYGKESSSLILPAPYLESLNVTKNLISKRLSYFLGEVYVGSSNLFYPLSFLLKTPISLLILVFISFSPIIFKKTMVFWLVFLYFFILSSISGLGFSHRYLLFIYPYVFIICGMVAKELSKRIWDKIFLIILIGFNIFSFFKAFPYPLSYVNEFIKKENAIFYFVDSNLDWGQGLIALKNYCKKENIDNIYLSYFGTASPKKYGIEFIPLPSYYQELYYNEFYPGEIKVKKGSFLAISATNLVGLYQPNYFNKIIDLSNPKKIIAGCIFIFKSNGDYVFKKDEKLNVWNLEEIFVLK